MEPLRARDAGSLQHTVLDAVEHALKVVLVNSSGDASTYDTGGALVTISHAHHEIHEGEFFSVDQKTAEGSNLADNVAISYGLTTGAEYYHLTTLGSCGGDAEIALYEGADLSGGVVATPLNHNRGKSGTSTMSVVSNPTINDVGTQLSIVFLPGGTGGNAIGEQSGEREEWILAPSTVYLLRLINRSGGAQPASLNASWYEESEN